MRSFLANALPALAAALLSAAAVAAEPAPAEPGLSASWPLQEGKGDTVLDQSGQANHGKISGAAWVQADGKTALKFTVADKSTVYIPNSPSLDLAGIVTIDLHLKTYGSTGNWQGILGKNDHDNHAQKLQYQLALDRRLQLLFTLEQGGKFWLPATNIVLKPNQWYHVVATYDAFHREVTILVDGAVAKRLTDAPVVHPSENPVRLGWTGYGNEFFNGELRQVRILNGVAVEKIAELRRGGVQDAVLTGTRYAPDRFLSGRDALSGILEANLLNPGRSDAHVTLEVKIGERTIRQDADVPAANTGATCCRVLELPDAAEAQVTLTEKGKTIDAAKVAIPGSKEFLGYRGFVVSHTHSDETWGDTPEVCLKWNMAAIAKALEIMQKQPDFHYCIETVRPLREYVRRNPGKVELLKRMMREGRFECGAFFTGPWELTCGGEGLIRQMYLGKLWVRKHLGADPDTVWDVDPPGHTVQMPQILQKAGIRGLVISAGAGGPGLFRWQAPDGTSLPTWKTPGGYGGALGFGIRRAKIDAAALGNFLNNVKTNHAAYGLPKIAFMPDGMDYLSPSERTGENIRAWNAQERFPPLASAATAVLFAAVEGAPLPICGGEMPSFWDAVQPQGNDCFMLDRRLEGRLSAAEKFAVLAHVVSPGFAYPAEQFEKIWENRLFTLDHNWGGKNAHISDACKTDCIRAANAINDGVLQSALQSLCGAMRCARPAALRVVVFNSLSWNRKDVVTCALPISADQAAKMVLVDAAGAVVPHQLIRSPEAAAARDRTEVVFCADVPSLGYATYYVAQNQAAQAAASPFQTDTAGNRFENDTYRIVIDAATGGIKSLYDKRGQRELVRQDDKYAFNEFVAREEDGADINLHFTGRQWLMREKPSTIKVVENGPVRLVVEVAGQILDSSTRKQHIILYRDLSRVDLVTTIGWEGKKFINLFQAFPLNLSHPTLKYAVPFGWQEYGKELKYAPLAGCLWRGVRGWIEAVQTQGSVTLASECNMVFFKDLAEQPEPGFLIQPLLLRTARSCGDANWFYTQKGEHRFRFALQPQADAARLGEQHSSPLLSLAVEGHASTSPSLPDTLSFAQVEPPQVQLAGMKRAEDGQGLILRLVETGRSQDTIQAEVQAFKAFRKAVKTNMLEEGAAAALGPDGHVHVPIRPFGIETVRAAF